MEIEIHKHKHTHNTPVSFGSQQPEVILREVVWCIPEVKFEHAGPGVGFREGDVDTLLKPPPDGRVQYPRDVCGSQHQHTVILVPHA
ncbi:hypothetical protein E2C01_101296 [Portunus trituberculatus]|uniref:Uncharacterized protein n=1 Tax=Portunus trituberculatus TaxID=210409 RepID=A0A5B7KFQ6_PORTR|nr:hypothetical protein [Portunus trituberculatus]